VLAAIAALIFLLKNLKFKEKDRKEKKRKEKIRFTSLKADGSETEATTKLTLTFDKEIHSEEI
jgi:hypothetical protein